MRILLTAINAKYIHSNLAVYNLKAVTAKYGDQIEIASTRSISSRMRSWQIFIKSSRM